MEWSGPLDSRFNSSKIKCRFHVGPKCQSASPRWFSRHFRHLSDPCKNKQDGPSRTIPLQVPSRIRPGLSLTARNTKKHFYPLRWAVALGHLGLQRIQSRGSLRVRLAGQKLTHKASLKSPQFPRECLKKPAPSHPWQNLVSLRLPPATLEFPTCFKKCLPAIHSRSDDLG